MTKQNNDFKPVMTRMTEIDEGNLNKIKEDTGLTFNSQAVKFALAFTASKFKPAYSQSQPKTHMTPEEKGELKARTRLATEESKEKLNLQKIQQSCEELFGTIDDDGVCHYPRIEFEKDGTIQGATVYIQKFPASSIDATYKKFQVKSYAPNTKEWQDEKLTDLFKDFIGDWVVAGRPQIAEFAKGYTN